MKKRRVNKELQVLEVEAKVSVSSERQLEEGAGVEDERTLFYSKGKFTTSPLLEPRDEDTGGSR